MTFPAVLGFRSAITAALFAATIDQLLKWLILEIVMQPPRAIAVTPFLNLALGFNAGVSFGLFREVFEGNPLLVAAGKSLVVVALLAGAALARGRMEAVGLGLVAGGATGNIIDRVRQGAVTDFVDFHVAGWHWPAFNFADAAIVTGAALILGTAFLPNPFGRQSARGAADVRSSNRSRTSKQDNEQGTVEGGK